MKHIKSYIKLVAVGIVIILFASCKQDHSHDHGDGTDDAHKVTDDPNEKEVHLNQAQFKNAGINIGWFEMKNLSDVVNANGYTKLDPQDEADVSMPISGTIKSINVIEGNYIKKGQILAKMSSLEYNKMLQEEAQMKERLALVKSELPYLKLEFERQEALAKDNINARKVFEKVSSDLKKSETKISSLNTQLTIVNQAIDMVSSAKGSTISIRAPISGYVTHVDAKIGTIVQPENSIFTIGDNSKMHVDLLIYEKDLSKVKVGQIVRFILTNQSNQEIQGKIYNIGKSFANDTKSVAVHAEIEENNANLIPGMYINALIDIGVNKVQTLPEDAIIMAEGRKFIFIQLEHVEHTEMEAEDHDEDEIEFARIEVITGASQLGHVEVRPLAEIPKGGKIVTHGAYYLQSHLQKSEGGGGHSH
jgi:cobalt-zinc-cadmium efflux system membrane fusion protein